MFMKVVREGATYPLLKEWETWQYAKGLSKRTVSERSATITRMADWCEHQPQAVQTIDIVEWLAEGDWSPNTRWTYYTTLNAWFLWLQKVGHREDNPMVNIDSPRRNKGKPHPVSDADLVRLLATRMHKKTRAMVMLAALQGFRVHEIAKVKGEHFNLPDQKITVKGKGGIVAVMPLNFRIADLAATMPARGYWFPGPDRGHQRRESVSGTIKEAMLRAGVPGSAHSLRHWFGTALVEAGVDLRRVQELLRHQNLATTEIYTLVSEQRLGEAINLLNPGGGPRLVPDVVESAREVIRLAWNGEGEFQLPELA